MANDHYEDADNYIIRADETRMPPTAILPLKPFVAHRVIRADHHRHAPVSVVGMRFDHDTKLWSFVCICESGDEVMIDEYDELIADLPYTYRPRPSRTS
ncbi:hypothetical protein [Brucella rhizosphaerae]|uniref:hypothetical protein n=1 Tax=Brucella rhizosphaerae TaxID=571254 RepID=UPI000462EEF8|nr:hypothetical protein [Brucella rhizosphaerae]